MRLGIQNLRHPDPANDQLPSGGGAPDRDQLTYKVELRKQTDRFDLVKISFGAESGNGPKVIDATREFESLNLKGGELVAVNGPASLPVAMALAHRLSHLYSAVACFDPKEGAYIVAVAHGGDYQPGQAIKADKEGSPLL